MFRICIGIGIAAVISGVLSPTSVGVQAQGDKNSVTVTEVTYDQLTREVVKHRGKVVVVDIWHPACINCPDGLAHLTKMYGKHAAEGLVAMSLCVNPYELEPAKLKNEALKILKDRKITIPNLVLNFDSDKAGDKLHVEGYPTVLIFNRQGKWKLVNTGKAEDVDRWILRFLKEK